MSLNPPRNAERYPWVVGGIRMSLRAADKRSTPPLVLQSIVCFVTSRWTPVPNPVHMLFAMVQLPVMGTARTHELLPSTPPTSTHGVQLESAQPYMPNVPLSHKLGGLQEEHAPALVLPATEYGVAASHNVGEVVPASQYDPGGHKTIPSAGEPVGQKNPLPQMPAQDPCTVLYLPAGHPMQVTAPGVEAYRPAGHGMGDVDTNTSQ